MQGIVVLKSIVIAGALCAVFVKIVLCGCLLYLFVLLRAHARLHAQEAINLQYGNNNSFVLPHRITYLFPAFAEGVVFHHTNFDKLDDLLALTDFCREIKQ